MQIIYLSVLHETETKSEFIGECKGSEICLILTGCHFYRTEVSGVLLGFLQPQKAHLSIKR